MTFLLKLSNHFYVLYVSLYFFCHSIFNKKSINLFYLVFSKKLNKLFLNVPSIQITPPKVRCIIKTKGTIILTKHN